MDPRSPFVPLEEPVSFASSTPRVLQTSQAGRVIGFGCSSAEQEAFESLKSYIQQAREQPASAQNFESELRSKVDAFHQQVVADQRSRSEGGASS